MVVWCNHFCAFVCVLAMQCEPTNVYMCAIAISIEMSYPEMLERKSLEKVYTASGIFTSLKWH